MQRVGFGHPASRFEVIKVRANFVGLKNQALLSVHTLMVKKMKT
jgi:hypothetical protein